MGVLDEKELVKVDLLCEAFKEMFPKANEHELEYFLSLAYKEVFALESEIQHQEENLIHPSACYF